MNEPRSYVGGSPVTPLELSHAAAKAAADKKAKDIAVLDLRGLVSYTDYMVLCTGQTPRQVAAIAEEVRARLKAEHGILPHKIDGEREADWILIDLLDAVVHVQTPEAREFYRLERLWRDAPREDLRELAAS